MVDEHAPLWVPQTFEELTTGLDRGIYESPRLDGKREVGSTKDVCKDVAAMANDGGVLLYGLDETDDHRLVLADVIDPHDAEEKISNAVRTGIHNPPRIFPIPLLPDGNGAGGYLVLVVPQSPLAPHMVDIGSDSRFYGRRGTQTARLAGEQVEALFARRRKTQRDALDALYTARDWVTRPRGVFAGGEDTNVVAAIPVYHDERALTVVVAPVLPAGRVVDKARDQATAAAYLEALWRERRGEVGGTWLEIVDTAARSWQVGVDSYLARHTNDANALGNCEIEVGREGKVVMRHAEAVGDIGREGPELREVLIVNLTRWSINCAGELYRDAGYLGPVVVGVHVAGLRGSSSSNLRDARQSGRIAITAVPEMMDHEYGRTIEVLSLEIPDHSIEVVRELLSDILEAATSGRGYPDGFSPFSEHSNE